MLRSCQASSRLSWSKDRNGLRSSEAGLRKGLGSSSGIALPSPSAPSPFPLPTCSAIWEPGTSCSTLLSCMFLTATTRGPWNELKRIGGGVGKGGKPPQPPPPSCRPTPLRHTVLCRSILLVAGFRSFQTSRGCLTVTRLLCILFARCLLCSTPVEKAVDNPQGFFFHQVRAIMGPQAYLLAAFEELWEKELPEDTEMILLWVTSQACRTDCQLLYSNIMSDIFHISVQTSCWVFRISFLSLKLRLYTVCRPLVTLRPWISAPESRVLFGRLWRSVCLGLVLSRGRNGGGYGSEDIRKLAYFESSIDPSVARTGVSRPHDPLSSSVSLFAMARLLSQSAVDCSGLAPGEGCVGGFVPRKQAWLFCRSIWWWLWIPWSDSELRYFSGSRQNQGCCLPLSRKHRRPGLCCGRHCWPVFELFVEYNTFSEARRVSRSDIGQLSGTHWR